MPDPTNTSVGAPASIAETLRQAKARIDTPDKWTKGAYASTTKRDSESHEVSVTSPDARYFCALGALRLIDGPFESEAIAVLASVIRRWWNSRSDDPHSTVYLFNDNPSRRHRDVMAAFDKAIAAAERAEAQS